MAAALAACASGGQRDAAHRHLGSIANELNERLRAEAAATAAPSAPLTFEQACLKMALANDALLASLANVRELEIDVAQSRSMIWPRAELRAFGEFAKADEFHSDFLGGVYLQFNLSHVLFLSDELAVARARKARAVEELRLRLRQVSQSLQSQLIEIRELEGEVAARERMELAARRALSLVDEAARAGRVRLGELWRLRVEAASQAALLAEARRKRDARRRDLALRLGSATTSDGWPITDPETVLRPLAPSEPVPDLGQLWTRRLDAHMAETDLFLARMARVAARRERLPRPIVNFGLGNIPLTSRREEATWVVRLGLEMPLIDFGDVSRRIKKAEVNVDLARRRATNVIIRMSREAQQTASDRRAAEEHVNEVSALLQEMRQAAAAGPILIEQYRADPIEVLTQEIRLGETEIRALEAEGALWKAAAAERLALGEPLLPELDERLLEALLDQKESME